MILIGLGDYEIENSEVIEDPVPMIELKVHEDKKATKKASSGENGENSGDDAGDEVESEESEISESEDEE
jgi:hypothetical protein